ncbi:hypothetical protein R1sor_008416 [Riccia sorocarpa]|uniref:Major facilitator superfamily (MFS) profile domain-containing protein n=1 Tax=Riccia sorocarpa TaxID=122646 RepID=A0ABD3HWY2_9MARC
MTEGHALHFESGGKYETRTTVYLLASSIMAATAGFLFGYDVGISGGVSAMADFQKKFYPSVYRNARNAKVNNYCRYDSQTLQLFTSSLQLAGFFTSLVAGYTTRKFGRRMAIIWGGLAYLLGAILNGAAVSLTMLIIGRVFLGIGVGLTMQAAPVYIAEIAPYQHRGALVNGFQFAITVGLFLSSLTNYFTDKIHPWGWRLSLGLGAAPALVITLGAILLPDSPTSYIDRGQVEKGRKVLEKIRGLKNVDVEFEDALEASRTAALVKNKFRDLLSRKNRPQVVISCFLLGMQPLTGNTAIAFYIPVIFRILGYGSSAALYSTAIVGSVRMAGSAISMVLVDRIGRKVLFLQGGIQMLICQIALGTIFYLELGLHNTLSKSMAAGVLVLVCLWTAGFDWSWGPLIWVVPPEIFSLESRSAGMGVAVSFNYIITFTLTQVFLTMFCHLRWGTFYFFAGALVFMVLFTTFLIPETRRIPLEEVKHIWAKHWFWKRFVATEEKEVNRLQS